MKRSAVLLLALAGTAHAEDRAEDLVKQGEEAGKIGDYTLSIAKFKAADKLEPHAGNACMIGLAYLRRELWPQAEVFFADCRRRATAADALPEWLPEAEQQLATKLASVDVAPIEILVEPADAQPTITISSFAPDEQFAPRIVHLAFGKHVIEVRAPGFETEQKTIDVTGREPQTIRIRLSHPGERATTSSSASPVPYYVMGGGAMLGLVGGLYTWFWVKPVYETLANTTNQHDYDVAKSKMQTRRVVEGALLGGAALTVGIGLVLRYTVFKPESPVRVTAHLGDGGGGIAISWDR